ncbi:MAG: hypothetical protein ACOC5T_01885 [Elusimicrobiota bacterium]
MSNSFSQNKNKKDKSDYIPAPNVPWINQTSTRCWFCKKEITKNKPKLKKNFYLSFPMHKKIKSYRKGAKRVKEWKKEKVKIPVCSSCKKRFTAYSLICLVISIGVVILDMFLAISLFYQPSGVLAVIFMLIMFSTIAIQKQIFISAYTHLIQVGLPRKLSDHPKVKKLLDNGWEFSQQGI